MLPADVEMIFYWMILLFVPAARWLPQVSSERPILLMYVPVIIPFLLYMRMFLRDTPTLYINGSLLLPTGFLEQYCRGYRSYLYKARHYSSWRLPVQVNSSQRTNMNIASCSIASNIVAISVNKYPVPAASNRGSCIGDTLSL